MTRVTTLDDSLQVVTAAMPGRASVAIGLWIRCGSRDEPARLNGISHFIEHLVFKGTRRRTSEQITREVEGAGGSLDASTSEEVTFYYAQVLAADLSRTLDVLFDMAIAPKFDAKHLDVQRDIVIEEIRAIEDRPSSLVEDLFSEVTWPNHPLGRRILGTERSLCGIRRRDLVEYHRARYRRSACVVAVTGNVQHDEAVALVRSAARRMPSGRPRAYRRVNNNQRVPRILVMPRETEEAHLVLGFRTFHRNHPARFTLKIISTLLGENMSSRLFERVREKHGLAYFIHSDIDRYMDTGCLYVGGGFDPARLPAALRAIVRELKRLRTRRVPAAELERAKQYTLGQLAIGLEKNMTRMVWMGENLLLSGRVPDEAETIRRLEAVTADDVQRVAQRIMQPHRLSAAIIGPSPNEARLRRDLELSED